MVEIKTENTTLLFNEGVTIRYHRPGENGGYKTVMSKNNTGLPCPVCGGLIKKESYLGGSIYYCSECQKSTNN